MNGFERLKEQVKDQQDMALRQTVDYLLSRDDMEAKYLNEEKTLEGMCKFVRDKGQKHLRNGWSYVTDELVYAWAVMYFALPNSVLKINSESKNKTSQKENNTSKNNVVSLEDAKQKIEKKKEVAQLSLFGGGT